MLYVRCALGDVILTLVDVSAVPVIKLAATGLSATNSIGSRGNSGMNTDMYRMI